MLTLNIFDQLPSVSASVCVLALSSADPALCGFPAAPYGSPEPGAPSRGACHPLSRTAPICILYNFLWLEKWGRIDRMNWDKMIASQPGKIKNVIKAFSSVQVFSYNPSHLLSHHLTQSEGDVITHAQQLTETHRAAILINAQLLHPAS